MIMVMKMMTMTCSSQVIKPGDYDDNYIIKDTDNNMTRA